MERSVPTVHIVGAGPGDPGLLTLRAAQLLQEADVVIHDALVSEAVLALVRPGARLIEAGKRCGRKRLTQEQVNRLVVEHALKGYRVVRLKGGDPTIFGRVAEELIALRRAGIPYEIVPGVSSATAVAARAGISLTERSYSSCLVFVTGHEAAEKEGATIDWSKLASLQGTIVVFMGLSRLEEIADQLIRAGLAPETPAMVMEWATLPREKAVRAPLKSLAQAAAAAGLCPPATIVIGDVVSIAERTGVQRMQPLCGVTVVVTRPREQGIELGQRLEELGAEVVYMPAIEVLPPESFAELDAALRRLGEYQWLAFTSANGVDAFFDRLFAIGLDVRALAGLRIAAVGKKTAEKLRARGVVADAVPEISDAEHLAAVIAAQGQPGDAVLFPAGERSRETLPRRLTEAGFRVDRVVCYRTQDVATIPPDLAQLLRSRAQVWVTAMSPATARSAHRLLESLGEARPRVKWISISPLTSAALCELGETDIVEAATASAESMVEAIVDAAKDTRRGQTNNG